MGGGASKNDAANKRNSGAMSSSSNLSVRRRSGNSSRISSRIVVDDDDASELMVRRSRMATFCDRIDGAYKATEYQRSSNIVKEGHDNANPPDHQEYTKNEESFLFDQAMRYLQITSSDPKTHKHIKNVLISLMKIYTVPAGTVVFAEEDDGTNLYIIEYGEVTVSRIEEDGTTANATYHAGDILGEQSLLFGFSRLGTATATEATKLWSLDRAALKVVEQQISYSGSPLIWSLWRYLDIPEVSILSVDGQERVLAQVETKIVADGQAVSTEGRGNTAVKVVETGFVDVHIPSSILDALSSMPRVELFRKLGVAIDLAAELEDIGPETDLAMPHPSARSMKSMKSMKSARFSKKGGQDSAGPDHDHDHDLQYQCAKRANAMGDAPKMLEQLTAIQEDFYDEMKVISTGGPNWRGPDEYCTFRRAQRKAEFRRLVNSFVPVDATAIQSIDSSSTCSMDGNSEGWRSRAMDSLRELRKSSKEIDLDDLLFTLFPIRKKPDGTKFIRVGRGCMLGIDALGSYFGTPGASPWMDTMVGGVPTIGAVSPMTALAVGDVTLSHLPVAAFEKAFKIANSSFTYDKRKLLDHLVKLARHKAELTEVPPCTLYTLDADSFSEVKQTGQLLESVGIMARAFVTDVHARMKACGITEKDVNDASVSASASADADADNRYRSEDKECAPHRGLGTADEKDQTLVDKAVSEIDKDLQDAQGAISQKDASSEDLILAAAKIANHLTPAQFPVRATGAESGKLSGLEPLESKLQKLPVSYALKIVYKGRGKEKGLLDSILNEAKMLASQPLQHSFIVKMHGKFQTDDALVLALERLPTIDLWSLLHQEKPSQDVSTLGDRQNYEDALSVDQVRFYVASVASALSHLHSHGIAYRNLKPENVMLDERGFIRLVSFGLAEKYPFANGEGRLQMKSYTVCGTAEYMAPEMVLMNGHNTAADAWALGIFMCELITGTTPFREASEVMRTRQTGRRMLMKLKDGDCHIMAAIADAQTQGVQVGPTSKKLLSAHSGCLDLIMDLLSPLPASRMRLSLIPGSPFRSSPYFDKFDLDALNSMSMTPPYAPGPLNETPEKPVQNKIIVKTAPSKTTKSIVSNSDVTLETAQTSSGKGKVLTDSEREIERDRDMWSIPPVDSASDLDGLISDAGSLSITDRSVTEKSVTEKSDSIKHDKETSSKLSVSTSGSPQRRERRPTNEGTSPVRTERRSTVDSNTQRARRLTAEGNSVRRTSMDHEPPRERRPTLEGRAERSRRLTNDGSPNKVNSTRRRSRSPADGSSVHVKQEAKQPDDDNVEGKSPQQGQSQPADPSGAEVALSRGATVKKTSDRDQNVDADASGQTTGKSESGGNDTEAEPSQDMERAISEPLPPLTESARAMMSLSAQNSPSLSYNTPKRLKVAAVRRRHDPNPNGSPSSGGNNEKDKGGEDPRSGRSNRSVNSQPNSNRHASVSGSNAPTRRAPAGTMQTSASRPSVLESDSPSKAAAAAVATGVERNPFGTKSPEGAKAAAYRRKASQQEVKAPKQSPVALLCVTKPPYMGSQDLFVDF